VDKIISDFGVQPIYLAAQAFNFLILLFVLKKFLYKPIFKVLEDRKKAVSDSLYKAKQIDQQFQAIEQESAKQLVEASRQAKVILENATNQANIIIADARKKTKTDVAQMLEKSKQDIQAERETMQKELRKELASLVVMGVERVSGKLLDRPDHLKIVDQTIETLNHETSD